MSGTPIPPNNQRSKRRAAIDAANKIKKIVNDDALSEDTVNAKEDLRKKNRKSTAPTKNSLLFNHQDTEPSPVLSISLSSLSSIPEDFCLSESTNIGSLLSPSPFGDEDHSKYFDEELKLANEEMELEFRRHQRLVNSTGPMFLSEKTAYRLSLYSPQTSPFHATKLSLTPFASVPTTPMHVYQYRASRGSSARRTPSNAARVRRVRSTGRKRLKGVKPCQLI